MAPEAGVIDDDYELVDTADEQLWSKWTALLTAEGWTSFDRPYKQLFPKCPTIRSVFARRKSDGALLSSIVWKENAEVAWIAAYLTIPEVRGRGIGSLVWQRAMQRIASTGLVFGLRSVKDMVDKYKAHWTPFEGAEFYKCTLTSSQLITVMDKIREKYPNVIKYDTSLVDVKVSEVGMKAFLELDKATTYCNRTDFWRKTLSIPESEAFVLMGEKNQPLALGAVSKTGHDHLQTFKIGCLFGSHVSFFACIVDAIVNHVLRYTDVPSFFIKLQSETTGDDLREILE